MKKKSVAKSLSKPWRWLLTMKYVADHAKTTLMCTDGSQNPILCAPVICWQLWVWHDSFEQLPFSWKTYRCIEFSSVYIIPGTSQSEMPLTVKYETFVRKLSVFSLKGVLISLIFLVFTDCFKTLIKLTVEPLLWK